ncbi:hypothetical protein [Actinoallomurus iriomotensis]|uniref:Uncharacterized protein n=1 Tax=Actinoallomurus iriomotensis TaxID=478107 RepID=A0A9W6RXC9_9ACTN|nr:hypothetical protein [Actinoallomurus iriomotensis]GLY81842.1 hypothetical protein Airi01_101090 [Actinoallomurus iriomotensis]
MPRVRFLQAVAGDDFAHVAGDVVEMSGEQAEAWADGVRAELVRSEAPETPERAAPAPETTSTATTAEKKDASSAAEKPSAARRRTRSTGGKPSTNK